MRVATVLAPNGLRPQAALTPPTNDEPLTKYNFYKPQVGTEFRNRFAAGQQTFNPKRVFVQTAQTMLFVSHKTGIRGEESQVLVDQLEGTTSRTGEIGGMQAWVEAMTSQSGAIWNPAWLNSHFSCGILSVRGTLVSVYFRSFLVLYS
jgi:hypothetical protein